MSINGDCNFLSGASVLVTGCSSGMMNPSLRTVCGVVPGAVNSL